MTRRLPPMVSIRALREAHGLTQTQMAERIAEQGFKITPQGVCNAETGNKRASKPLMAAWARALGIKPLDVLQHEELCERVDDTSADTSAGAA